VVHRRRARAAGEVEGGARQAQGVRRPRGPTGHCSEKILRLLDEAAEDPSRKYTSCIDWTREYIDFYEGCTDCETGPELVSRIRLATRTSGATTSPSSGSRGYSFPRAARNRTHRFRVNLGRSS